MLEYITEYVIIFIYNTCDNANRLKTLITQKSSTVLASYTYEYDKVGNIISVTGTENVQYTYDNLYRLKISTVNGVTTTYTYDNRDNLISEKTGNNTKTYTYSGNNRLIRRSLFKISEKSADNV